MNWRILFHQIVANVADVVADVYDYPRTIDYRYEVDSNERFSNNTDYEASLPDIYETGTTGWGCQMSRCKYCTSNFFSTNFTCSVPRLVLVPGPMVPLFNKYHEKDHLETLPQNKTKKAKKAKKAKKTLMRKNLM
jgi:hypothetical protein